MNSDKVSSSRIESKKAISQIVISGMMLALALIMEWVSKLIPFFSWPMGGSVSLTMVPLILIGLYCGPVYGTIVSILFGGINFLMDGVISWTPNVTAVLLSLLLDYVIGFGACGLSSIFRKPFFEKKAWAIVSAVVLCGFTRFVSSFFSGMIVFTQAFDYNATTGLSPAFTWGGFIYSLSYNGGYMLPSIVLDAICMLLLAKPLYTISKSPIVRPLVPENSENTASKFFNSSFEKMFLLYILVGLVLGIVSSIPALKLSYFGYFGLVLGVALLAYIVYKMCKEKKGNTLMILYLFFTLITIAVCLLGILSAFTYGASFYVED